jgi:hypothetical protein
MQIPFLNTPQRWALLFLILLLAGFGVYQLAPSKRLKARHEAFIEWARSGASSDFAKDFASSSYTDQWGFSPSDVGQRVRAARMAYPHLTIHEEEPEVSFSGRTAAVIQGITAESGDGDTRRFTIHCTWERESFWPWSWKLKRVEAPDLEF